MLCNVTHDCSAISQQHRLRMLTDCRHVDSAADAPALTLSTPDTTWTGAAAVDAQLLVQCVAPSAETAKRVAQRQDFAARCISSLAGPDGDAVAKEVPTSTPNAGNSFTG